MAMIPSHGGKTPRTGKARSRRGVRRGSEPRVRRLVRLAQHPTALWGLLIWVAFVAGVGTMVAWAREQPQLIAGRTARETRTIRVEFDALNAQQTAQQRENARQNTPRVYRCIEATVDAIVGEIDRLPSVALLSRQDSGAENPARLPSGLTPEQIEALRAVGADAAQSSSWRTMTERFRGILLRNPLLERADWERARTEGLSRRLELVHGAGSEFEPREQAINIDDPAGYADRVSRLVRSAGFESPAGDAVIAVMQARAHPTYDYDAAATQERQEIQAERVQPVIDKRAVGQTIFTRGDIISPTQLLMYEQELAEYSRRAPTDRIWPRRLGVAGLVMVCGLALGIALVTLAPRAVSTVPRIAWLAGLTGATVGVSAVGTIVDPSFVALSTTAPVALLAVLLVTVHDRTVALIAGVGAALLISLAVIPAQHLVIINLIGIGTVLWTLPGVYDRGGVVAMSLWLVLALGLSTAVSGFATLPMDPARIIELLTDASAAGFGGLLVGGVTLFILPAVERAFNITTGMTLVELRDPKQALLRELQQRAPGTYNHSLNVATIAESAAAAIEADTLLTYAGALYHDIGKMTKPEYFVENQSGGVNRHDRLSPAMSVLVIIGHVKDGLELAREYGLPRPLHHFIEAHHGTTLVEYFYHRAKQQAEIEEEDRGPAEFDYRYPGPKPRTKEVAILMLADAVESATRTLREPTPSRIEAVVQQLADKRLMDGQFDECDLTLRELHKVVESISKTVASIHHGRVQYPGDRPEKKPEAAREKSAS